METENQINEILLSLEKTLFRSREIKKKDEVDLLIASDFIEFGSSGRIFNKQEVIDALLQPSNE